jgi:hypothetical protein
MVDTSIEHALKLSIEEFNDWCLKANQFQKHSLNDLKGIFFNKLIKNLKSTNLINNYWDRKKYSSEYINEFVIDSNKLIKLSFKYDQYTGSDIKEVIDKFNSIITTLNLDTVNGVIQNFAENINNFKIMK